jgi:FlaA1/EpsC-like NDP-sugar epimerase
VSDGEHGERTPSGHHEGFLEGKRLLVTGGTGSLGKAVVHRALSGRHGLPSKVIVFSRDEGKHHQMRVDFAHARAATDDIAYHNFEQLLEFRIGDVREYRAVSRAVQDADTVMHCAALKQVPSCEYFPWDAVNTNVAGAQNVAWAIQERSNTVSRAIAISTDKACKPINVMGMTKAIQERIFVEANVGHPSTVFSLVRYGNVVASRGSVIPLFEAQIAVGGPVTVTAPDMTRFLLSMDAAVDAVFTALRDALPGETYVPILPSVRVLDLAKMMIGSRPIEIRYTGIRPGEKVHEILVSAEERYRTIRRGDYYVIQPMLPEIQQVTVPEPALDGEYSSAERLVDQAGLLEILGGAGRAGAVSQHVAGPES